MASHLAWLLTRTEPWELLRQLDGEYCCKVGTWLRGPEPVSGYGTTVEYAIAAARAKYEQRRAA